MSHYAWLITEDCLADAGGEGDAGVSGPSDAPDELLIRLGAGEGNAFRLYDDDQELYYTGRLLTDDTMNSDDEEACYAPLGDFGEGWAGCTEVRWPGHSDWDCGPRR